LHDVGALDAARAIVMLAHDVRPPRVGVMSMLSLISKPESRASLQALLKLARKPPARTSGG
jgi:hypothetical protein